MPLARTATVLRYSLMFLLVPRRLFQYFFKMTPNFACFVVLIATSNIAARTSPRKVELAKLINGVQNHPLTANEYPPMIKSVQDDSSVGEDKFCQIEYQVTRKEIGKCVKLGHGVTGCVSDDFVYPDHRDCF